MQTLGRENDLLCYKGTNGQAVKCIILFQSLLSMPEGSYESCWMDPEFLQRENICQLTTETGKNNACLCAACKLELSTRIVFNLALVLISYKSPYLKVPFSASAAPPQKKI